MVVLPEHPTYIWVMGMWPLHTKISISNLGAIVSLVYFTNRPLERSTLWTELNGRIRRKGQYKVNLTVGWWAVKSVCARKKARKSRGSEGRKAKLSSDLKFWHNPLLLHEEGRKEDEVETLDRPVMIIQSEVGCVCGMCNFLYITTRRVPILHQRLVKAEIACRGRCTPPDTYTVIIYKALLSHTPTFHRESPAILFKWSHIWNSSLHISPCLCSGM